ncbi:hypothetical protein V5799_002164 [Amblyomma americanum]|uniref:M13 family peptidase n=1 Tax=Amblyomma americanum TaxID=6943 RepID=A0AAQ4CY43_AMBAM
MRIPFLASVFLFGVSQAASLLDCTEQPTSKGNLKIRVCQSRVCRNKADEIRKTLSRHADPCEDFYKFVCSGWKKAHPAPKDRARYGPFQVMDEKVHRQLRALLRNATRTGKERQRATDKAKIAYRSCAANRHPDARSLTFLKKILAKKGLDNWPLARTKVERKNRILVSVEMTTDSTEPKIDSSDAMTESTDASSESVGPDSASSKPAVDLATLTEPTTDWTLPSNRTTREPLLGDYKSLLLKAGMSPLFQLAIVRDSENLSSHIISLDQVTFLLLRRNELMHPDKHANRGRVKAYKSLIQTTLRVMKPNLSRNAAEAVAEDIFDFESELAKRASPEEDRRDEWKIHRRTSIRALEATFKGLPLLDLLNNEFRAVNLTLTADENVAIFAIPYFESTTKLVQRVDIRTLYNYVGWRVMQMWAVHVSKKFRSAKQRFKRVAYGLRKDAPLWKKCVKILNTYMHEAVGNLYATHKSAPHVSENVEKLVKEIKTTFRNRLKSITWMDNVTQERAIHKLEEMDSKVGYPPWMMDTRYLELIYRNLEPLNSSDPFVEIFYKIYQNYKRSVLMDLRRPFNRTLSWSMAPAAVNAFYDSEANGMVIPSAIQQGAFYQDGLPASLNFGSMGFIVGHVLAHGFDDYGSQYDASGSLRRWWSNDTRRRFMQKAECFVHQYGDIVDKTVNMSLNGRNTLGENIADNGAIRLAFKAYQRMKRRSKLQDLRLPGLKKFSGEQLFFIANAMMWCTNWRKEYLGQHIQYNPHSPSNYRVNIPFKNFPAFSKAFKCTKKSAMYPGKNKCVLW